MYILNLQLIHMLHMTYDFIAYHSPPAMAHKSCLQPFSPFNYLSLSHMYSTYPHIFGYYMYFDYLRLLSLYYQVYFVYTHQIITCLKPITRGGTQSTYMTRYEPMDLMIHWSPNHISRYQSTILLIWSSPNHISWSARSYLLLF